jgi:phosphate starvation-inducible protein PhoH and related proteins
MSGERQHAELEVHDTAVLMSLTTPNGRLLEEVSRCARAQVDFRGNKILVSGEQPNVELARRFLADAAELIAKGVPVGPQDVASAIRSLRDDPASSLTSLLEDSILVGARRRAVVPKSRAQRDYVRCIRDSDLTFGIGPAGTGKTYLAMAMAASALTQRLVKRVVLTRPAVEAGERLGFLPGDLAEKVSPYLRPLYDALNDMLEFDKVEQLRERGQIEVAPLAFMRGRTLNNAFVILDEAQNATSEQMRMFLTRLGFGSKAVVTGDVTQTDLPPGARPGLKEAEELLSGIEGISCCRFTDADVVRHPLVQKIVVAYERSDERRLEARERRTSTGRNAGLSARGPRGGEPRGSAERDGAGRTDEADDDTGSAEGST